LTEERAYFISETKKKVKIQRFFLSQRRTAGSKKRRKAKNEKNDKYLSLSVDGLNLSLLRDAQPLQFVDVLMQRMRQLQN
jgi:hypothetical protein